MGLFNYVSQDSSSSYYKGWGREGTFFAFSEWQVTRVKKQVHFFYNKLIYVDCFLVSINSDNIVSE
jgi:hypothetical protein